MDATYEREPLKKGTRGTCPMCVRLFQVSGNGRMVRHGWKEKGRQVGSYGLGRQWGECQGWSKRPIEETDADALVFLKAIRDAQRTSEDLAELHREGALYYDREVLAAKRPEIPGGDVFGHYARTDLEVVGVGTRAAPDPMSYVRGTVQREYRIYRIPRGYEPEQYNYNVRSYEQLRAATEKDHTLQAKALKDAADFLEDAIERERRR
jgi:hypothetical protein